MTTAVIEPRAGMVLLQEFNGIYRTMLTDTEWFRHNVGSVGTVEEEDVVRRWKKIYSDWNGDRYITGSTLVLRTPPHPDADDFAMLADRLEELGIPHSEELRRWAAEVTVKAGRV